MISMRQTPPDDTIKRLYCMDVENLFFVVAFRNGKWRYWHIRHLDVPGMILDVECYEDRFKWSFK